MNMFSLSDIAAVADAIGMIEFCKTIDDGRNRHENQKEHYNIPASAVYEYARKHEADIEYTPDIHNA